MAAQKKSTHTVSHGNLYFSVGGKLQKLKIGHELVLTDDQAKNLGNKVKAISGEKSIDATSSKDDQ